MSKNWITKITPNHETGKIDVTVRNPYLRIHKTDSSLDLPISDKELEIRLIKEKLNKEIENE